MFYKSEKEIQKDLNNRILNGGYKYNILDEEGKNFNLNEDHPYLILNPFEEIKGLMHHIKENNKSLIEENKEIYPNDELVEIIKNDFIYKYDNAKNNAELYRLIFEPGALSINIKDKNNVPISRNYNVISHSLYANNQFYIIKEKRILASRGVERPDFALYINSIPLIVFEVKTPKAGIEAAFKDYVSKESYQKFLLCLGTDGNEAFLTGSKTQKFKWKKYGENKVRNIFNDISDFMDDTMSEEKIKDLKLKIESKFSDKEKLQILNFISHYILSDVKSIFEGISEVKLKEKEIKNSFLLDVKDIFNNETSGLEDLIEEFIDNPENLFFYMKYCILTDKNESSYYLINHRVQQYYTIKKLDHKLKIISLDKNIHKKNYSLLNELVVHVQRSGKSITIRSAVNIIAEKYNKLFKKIYICVPDLTILSVMKKTFKNNKIKVKKISSRYEYVKSISENPTVTTFYLYNIQKTKDGLDKEDFSFDCKRNNKYLKSDVMFIIDEVHFSQDKQQADIRRSSFPNASFLSFTATPKIKEKSNEKINYTATLYSDSDKNGNIHYLDELILEDAIKMDIVLPVRFEKLKFQQNANIESAREVDLKVLENANKYLKEGEHKRNIEEKQEEEEFKIRKSYEEKVKNGKMNEEDLFDIIKNSNQQVYNKYLSNMMKEVEIVENENLIRELRKEKINFIVNDMNFKREKCYSTTKGLNFKTKAFLVVKSQNEAQNYINAVKEMSLNNSNTYSGYRFGVDFSQQQISTNNIDIISELNGINSDQKIINLFESQKEDSVDILIIVDKYLMGYDNQELVCVYCDKTINEPAKLFQLITRSATVRLGKKQGFFVDMTFSEDNYDTYINKALAYYNSGGAKIATLSEYEVKIQKDKIKNYLGNIKSILDIPQNELLIDTIGIYKKLTSKDQIGRSVSEIIKRKNEYFEEFRKINNALEILINPKYYLEEFDEILVLSKVNFQYLNENMPKNKEKDIIFDRNEIEEIILKSIRFFDFDSTESFNSFKVNESIIKNDIQHGKMEFNNVVDEFKCKVAMSRNSLPLGFTEMITKWSDQIMSSKDAKIIINEFVQKIVKPYEDEEDKIKDKIDDLFNGSKLHYLAYENLKKIDQQIKDTTFEKKSLNKKETLLDNSLISQSDIEDFIFVYSKIISEYIDKFITFNESYFNDQQYLINKIKIVNTFDFKDILNERINKFENREILFNLMRRDQKRIREIIILEDSIVNTEVKIDDTLDLLTYTLIFIFEDIYFHIKNDWIN